jgi:hypothetical protein
VPSRDAQSPHAQLTVYDWISCVAGSLRRWRLDVKAMQAGGWGGLLFCRSASAALWSESEIPPEVWFCVIVMSGALVFHGVVNLVLRNPTLEV